MSDLKQWIQEQLIRADKNLNSQRISDKYLSNNYNEQYKQVKEQTQFLPENSKNAERLYCIFHNITSRVTCEHCGKLLKFKMFKNGYLRFCSAKCSANSDSVKNVREKTNEERYGVKNVAQCNSIKAKISGSIQATKRRYDINIKDSDSVEFQKQVQKTKQTNIETKTEVFNFIKQYFLSVSSNESINSDIYIPEKKIAIEYDGVYWHSERMKPDRKYHLNKTNLCEEQGVQLLHIFESEWLNKPDIVKSVILSKLGIFDRRYFARKCSIKEIDPKTKNKFLNENHLQGDDNSSTKLGLFFENELVCVMTFGKRKITGGLPQMEMIRFCNKQNVQVVGGASKLFKHFINNYEFSNIVTYADRRYSNGEFYKKLGFDFKHVSSPNYWYFHYNDDMTLHHRVSFQKHKLEEKLETFDPQLTEYQNMLNNGFNRIWDCGNFVFEFSK